VYGSGHTVPWGGTAWIALDAARTVKEGAITVDLSSARAGVGSRLENQYGWSTFATTYGLDTIASVWCSDRTRGPVRSGTGRLRAAPAEVLLRRRDHRLVSSVLTQLSNPQR
jgi:hypothetical protein